MQRRQFIKGGIGLAAVGVAGWWWLAPKSGIQSLNAIKQQINDANIDQLVPDGSWSVAHTFTHLAQSIEFSMLGYPQSKPPLFQSTLGKAAFALFKQNGAMVHDVEEAIPGAPEIASEIQPARAKARLINAIDGFIGFEGELQPHFAFGHLERQDYAIAHALHIQDHLPSLT